MSFTASSMRLSLRYHFSWLTYKIRQQCRAFDENRLPPVMINDLLLSATVSMGVSDAAGCGKRAPTPVGAFGHRAGHDEGRPLGAFFAPSTAFIPKIRKRHHIVTDRAPGLVSLSLFEGDLHYRPWRKAEGP